MRKFVGKKSSEALDWLSAVITSVSVGEKLGNSLFKKNHTQIKMFYEETTIYLQILLSYMYFKDSEYFKIYLQVRKECNA